MGVVPFTPVRDVEGQLCRAIHERRVVTFGQHGLSRRAEPHDFGVINGVLKLFFYQVGGQSRSGRPVGWRWALLGDVRELLVLDDRFPGPREAHTGRHVHWDRLIASVSREPD
jgi:hypothetical protein